MAQGKRTAIANRERGQGKAAPDANIPQPAIASRSQLAQIRERLTCEDARFWFDFQIKPAARNLLVTETSLAEFREWAEAEAEVDYWQRESTRRRLAGEPITSRETVIVPARQEVRGGIAVQVDEQQVQALGVATLLRFATERAGKAREKNGFNPLDITKIRTLRQRDMWAEDPAGEAAKVVEQLMDMARNTALKPECVSAEGQG